MPVFKCFFKLILHNRMFIIIYLVIFLFMIFFFTGGMTTSVSDVYSDTPIPIAVIDRDGSELSQALSGYLGSRHKPIELADDAEILQDALFYRNVEYILFIPDGFEKDLTGGAKSPSLENVKLPQSTSGIYVDNQIDRYIATLKTYLNAGYEPSLAAARTAGDLLLGADIVLDSEMHKGPGQLGVYFQILPYILMSVIIYSLGPVLMAFNDRDMSMRMESSSLKLRERNLQIALGCVLPSLAIWAIFILVARLIFSGEVLSFITLLQVLNSFMFLAVSVSIAFLLGQFLKSSNGLSLITNAVSLGMSFLCGVFVSQDLLGPEVLSIAKYLPVYWYIKSNDMLSVLTELNAANSKLYTEGILIQAGFAVAIFAVALAVSRQKKINAVI